MLFRLSQPVLPARSAHAGLRRVRGAADRDLIRADGVFGVPFRVDGSEKYRGHDRFELWLEGRD